MNTQEIQKIYKWALVVLIVLAVFLGVQTLITLKNFRNVSPSYNTITVSGEGEVVAVPDLASFSFAVSADAKTVAEAQEVVTKKVDAVLAEVKSLGVQEKDIKTTDYSVYPRYSYSNGTCTANICPPSRQTLDGYTARHNVSIKVRNPDDAGKILAAAGSKGATEMSNISFTIDEPEKLKEEARAKAIENAREKAKVLSRDLDVRLVRVVSFFDNSDVGPQPMYKETLGMGGSDAAVAPRVPNIPTGENKIKSVVNVTYEIR